MRFFTLTALTGLISTASFAADRFNPNNRLANQTLDGYDCGVTVNLSKSDEICKSLKGRSCGLNEGQPRSGTQEVCIVYTSLADTACGGVAVMVDQKEFTPGIRKTLNQKRS